MIEASLKADFYVSWVVVVRFESAVLNARFHKNQYHANSVFLVSFSGSFFEARRNRSQQRNC